MKENNPNNYRDNILEIISSFAGQNNLLTIPRIFIDFCGDIPTALLLSQLLYWTDRTKRQDGYIFKSYKDWKSELSLSERQVKRASNKLKKDGILETKLKKAYGAPTLHYRLKKQSFSQWIITKMKDKKELNSKMDSTQKDETSNIDYNINYNKEIRYNTLVSNETEKDKSFLIFNKIRNKKSIENFPPEVSEKILEYLQAFERNLNETHPSINDVQMSKVLESFQNLYYATEFNEYRDFNEIVHSYFNRKDVKADYNINHFAAWINGLVNKMGFDLNKLKEICC
jgi:hypothetical protein